MPNGSSQNSARDTVRLRCIDVSPGDSVDSCFLLASLEQRAKKNGDPYFFLTLRDCTGSLNAVMWDNHQLLVDGMVKNDDFVRVEGSASEYNGGLQITLRRVARLDDSEIDMGDFLAVSPRPRSEMEAELDAHIEAVQNADCRKLLDRLFGHSRFRELFCTAPAAASIHQAYIGGLLEHTLNVLRNALHLGETYQPFDRDLLVTAGLLHDIGKIREFDWKRSITYTDEGRLIGHITIGANIVDQSMRAIQGFSEHYRQHILHVILSHHGKLEYGSPVVPKTREALLLHYADYIDAYMTSYVRVTDEARARGENWSAFNRIFESYLFAGGNGSARSDAVLDPADLKNTPPASQESRTSAEESAQVSL